METGARRIIGPRLERFEPIIRDCYEAGVVAPTLTAVGPRSEHLRCAALFLKRGLTDLRASWLLVSTGYSGAAAAVIASLWENALTVVALCDEPARIGDVKASKEGDIPWPPMQLAKFAATATERDSLSAGITDKFELAWRQIYGPYKWLCKIKHPTFRSANHEAFSASVEPDEFVVMAAPDIRPGDDGLKATLFAIAIARLSEAIESFVASFERAVESPHYVEYRSRMDRVKQASPVFIKAIDYLPFDIARDKVSKEYVAMRRSGLVLAHDA